MGLFYSPYDSEQALSMRCSCGQDHTVADHQSEVQLAANRSNLDEQRANEFVQAALLKALFPNDQLRRNFLRAVGKSTAAAAISTFLPIGALQAMAQERGALEKNELNIGFLPITCATPIVAADPLGFYSDQGLKVNLKRTAGWAVVRDKTLAGEFDASHMLSPMPLAMTMGIGSAPSKTMIPAIENLNGNAITLSIKHKDKRDPKQWKGMRFAIPFDYSMHNFLLRYYLAEHGLDPDKDVQLRVMAPPDMVANLRADNIDGFIVAEPFNQRAVFDGVGFIHMLTSEIWDNHPCCAFAVSSTFVEQNPNTFAALFRAIVTSTNHCSIYDNRAAVAKAIHGPNLLNQPLTILEQVLLGRFADGLGQIRNEPNRINFEPFPWQSMAVWMLTQMKRWGYVKEEIDYQQIAQQVFLATDARKQMEQLGIAAPDRDSKSITIMGKVFDPAKPKEYVESFQISQR